MDELEEALDGLPHADEVVGLLRRHYRPEATVAEAFHGLVQDLFGAHGLLVVDPMAPGAADDAAPVHAHAFSQARPLAQGLLDQAAHLQARGLPAPVHVRAEAPLCFVHPEGLAGPRYRAEPVDEATFLLCGTERTAPADEVASWPRTTSALLRPILQDTWLPTAAYLGGPGELAYLAQLPPLWAAYDLPTPLIVPRSRFALIDPPARRALEALDLTVDDLSDGREALLARLGTAKDGLPDPDALLAALRTAALATLEDFRPGAAALDHGLARSVDKTADLLTTATDRLVDRYRKALARDDALVVDRLDRLLDRVQPGGAPQERVFGFASFAARTGVDALVQALIDAVVPFDPTLRSVTL